MKSIFYMKSMKSFLKAVYFSLPPPVRILIHCLEWNLHIQPFIPGKSAEKIIIDI